jgi:hypothetical protein
MKKIYWIIILVAVLLIGWVFVRLILGGSEDDWIKNSRGVWIKHGEPYETPEEVLEQQEAINCASNLYKEKEAETLSFSSQCIGTCEDYAIDIVHVPRNTEDNKLENQCSDFKEGRVSHFIELNKYGEIVRVV